MQRNANRLCFILVWLCLCSCKYAFAETLFVPSDEYPTIQAGIDAAEDGDTVLVVDGTYSGEGNIDIDFLGKSITVSSENGPENCIIDPQRQGRGAVFQNEEGPNAILNGFTIRNAKNGFIYANDNGAGIYCENASPTISHCIIENCESVSMAGGIYFRNSEASVSHCIIRNNIAPFHGGGMYCINSPVDLSHCSITGNSSMYGGGITASESPFKAKGCVIRGNLATYVGGGFYLSRSDPEFVNCIIAFNSSDTEGGGLYVYNSRLEIINCTLYGNTAAEKGGGMFFNYNARAEILNSVLWGNLPGEIVIDEYDSSIAYVTHSNVQGGYNGEGNFQGEPLFVDPRGDDFRLSIRSPCVDTGAADGAPDDDIRGMPRPRGAGVDLGAIEFTESADSRPWITTFTTAPHPVSLPMEITFTCAASDPDGVIATYTIDFGDGSAPETNDTGVFTHTYTTSDASAICNATDDSGITVNSRSLSPLYNGYINVPGDYPDIQSAMDAAADKANTTVWVDDGIYRGEKNRNLDFKGKAITVRSRNGPAHTIIHCERAGRGFLFQNKELRWAVVNGFTITYGAPVEFLSGGGGGAIYCYASPTIENCIIENNEGCAVVIGGSPLLKGCIVTKNRSLGDGGGINISWGAPVIDDCVISKNISLATGAGEGTGGGGGICFQSLSLTATIINSVISKNFAVSSGGGIRGSSSAYTAINCTFHGNVSAGGGAVYHYSSSETFPTPTLENCIFWGNVPDQIRSGSAAYSNPLVVHSNIQDGYPGEGNISQEPDFFDPDGDDYTLRQNSPCIDAGTPNEQVSTDMVGVLRPQSSGYDMGAFEALPVDPGQPVIDSFTADVTEGAAPLEVSFSCTAHDADGIVSTYTIDFGDGSDVQVNADGTFSHSYASVGKSFAVCTATDDQGKRIDSKKIAIDRQGVIRVPEDYASIQEAIDAVDNGDSVLVANGVYTGHLNKNLMFWGKAITVQSENGPEHTIIDCENDGRGFTFRVWESNDSVVSGFKIMKGYVDDGGGGIFCYQASPTIANCIIQDSIHDSTVRGGGGICCYNYSSPTIINTIVRDNMSDRWGGGIFCHTYCYPTIISSTIQRNTAISGGGGIYNYSHSYSSVINSIISGNSVASGQGGGIYSRSSYLVAANNIISGNSAAQGGGLYVETSDFPGIDDAGNNAIISNCTIIGNTGDQGAGIYYWLKTPAPTTNSIIRDNVPDEIDLESIYGHNNLEPDLSHCNVKGGYPGDANIDAEPKFLDPDNGDYHLLVSSPCIDAGTTEMASSGDIDGESRPAGNGYDIGADEFVDADGDGLSSHRERLIGTDSGASDTDTDGMSDGWEVDSQLDPLANDAAGDADGDNFSNLAEYQNGTDPNDPVSYPVATISQPLRAMPWIPLLLLDD